ncbi:MAG: ATP-binding domain-containing protein, partial [Ottowia sp.]|nr:ATP-binding domain-containing protein [Ottowia sp.]
EFDAVFITGLEEGLFPHENSMESTASLEEERRLMYVAITRARARLYLSCAQARMLHGRVRYNIRSRFLDELPEDALHWLSPHGMMSSKKEADTAPQTTGAPPGSVPGQRVFHPKFGEGRVLAVQGQGADAKAQVRFARHGSKWLLLDKARLTLIGDDE